MRKIYQYRDSIRQTKGYDRANHPWKTKTMIFSKDYYRYLESKDDVIRSFENLVYGMPLSFNDGESDALVAQADYEMQQAGFKGNGSCGLIDPEWDAVAKHDLAPYVEAAKYND